MDFKEVVVAFGDIVCQGFVDAEFLPLENYFITVKKGSSSETKLFEVLKDGKWGEAQGLDCDECRVVDAQFVQEGTRFTIERRRKK